MTRIENQSFGNEVVSVDGKQFVACTFNNSTLLYAGGELPSFGACQFNEVALQFEDSAVKTIKFLSGLREGGFSQAVDKIIQGIRQIG
jgi:hypothetical protein